MNSNLVLTDFSISGQVTKVDTISLGVLPIVQLAMMSRLFKDIDLSFEPRKFQMTQYERDVTPGLIGKLTNVGIERVHPRWEVGRVRSYEALPYQRPDPAIIVCSLMDLAEYYHYWNILLFTDSWHVRDVLVNYDAAIAKAIRSARELTQEEIHFAICEMLHSRNQVLGRAR